MKSFKFPILLMLFAICAMQWACTEIPLKAPHTENNEYVQDLIDNSKREGITTKVTEANQKEIDARLNIKATSFDTTDTGYLIYELEGVFQSDSLVSATEDVYLAISDGEKVIYSEKISKGEPFKLRNISWVIGPKDNPQAKAVYICYPGRGCHCYEKLEPVK